MASMMHSSVLNHSDIIEGNLPKRAQRLLIDWANLYQQDLLQMWSDQEFCKLPPLQ